MAKVLVKVILDTEEIGNGEIEDLVEELFCDSCIYPESIWAEIIED